MSADNELESRLRAGLRAAGEALPPAGPGSSPGAGGAPDHPSRQRRGRRTWLAAAAAAAVVVAATGVGVAALGGEGEEEPDLQVAQTPSTSDTTVPDGPPVDPVPGTAVAVGTELVSFGADGQAGERLSLAPLTGVQSLVSDRHGGWIACGMPESQVDPIPPAAGEDGDGAATTTSLPDIAATTTVPGDAGPTSRDAELSAAVENLGTDAAEVGGANGQPTQFSPNTYRFRPGQEPEPLDVPVWCVADSLGVTEVGGHDVLVYLAADFTIHQRDLETGADTPLPIPTPSGPGMAAVGGGQMATFGESGLVLWDLATGTQVATVPADLPFRAPGATSGLITSDLALSPDAGRLAVLVGDPMTASAEVVVVDVASGAEVFRRAAPVALEGVEIAFDGSTVAVGNFYDSYGPVRVFDVASGAERTVDAHGLLP
jgi:hypothetical protein